MSSLSYRWAAAAVLVAIAPVWADQPNFNTSQVISAGGVVLSGASSLVAGASDTGTSRAAALDVADGYAVIDLHGAAADAFSATYGVTVDPSTFISGTHRVWGNVIVGDYVDPVTGANRSCYWVVTPASGSTPASAQFYTLDFAGANYTNAYSYSSGKVVGSANASTDVLYHGTPYIVDITHAVYWESGTRYDLTPTLAGTSAASGVSGNRIVGYATVEDGMTDYATLWEVSGSGNSASVNQITLSSYESHANAIRGSIVGGYLVVGGMQHAAVWHGNAASQSDINPTDTRYASSAIADVADGVVIGGQTYDVAVGLATLAVAEGTNNQVAGLWLMTWGAGEESTVLSSLFFELAVASDITNAQALSIALDENNQILAIYGIGNQENVGQVSLVWTNADIAVPEPLTAGMLVMAGAAMLLRRGKSVRQ